MHMFTLIHTYVLQTHLVGEMYRIARTHAHIYTHTHVISITLTRTPSCSRAKMISTCKLSCILTHTDIISVQVTYSHTFTLIIHACTLPCARAILYVHVYFHILEFYTYPLNQITLHIEEHTHTHIHTLRSLHHISPHTG